MYVPIYELRLHISEVLGRKGAPGDELLIKFPPGTHLSPLALLKPAQKIRQMPSLNPNPQVGSAVSIYRNQIIGECIKISSELMRHQDNTCTPLRAVGTEGNDAL